jgi:hypothetical protein
VGIRYEDVKAVINVKVAKVDPIEFGRSVLIPEHSALNAISSKVPSPRLQKQKLEVEFATK